MEGKKLGTIEAAGQLTKDILRNKLYATPESSEAYDFIAKKYFDREKLGHDIAQTFNLYLPGHLKIEDAIICDRAAGTGIISRALSDYGFQVRASDLNVTQLEQIRQTAPSITTVREDFNELMTGVEDESVHGVVQVGATRYMTVNGQVNYVREAQRVLVENGLLIWPVFRREIPEAKLKHGWSHKSGFQEIVKLLETNGFEILSADYVVHGFMYSTPCSLVVARKNSDFEHNQSLQHTLALLRKSFKIRFLSNLP